MTTTQGAPDPADALVPTIVQQTRDQLRAPRAAGIAGLAFALLFTAALVILRNLPIKGADDAQIAEWFSSGQDQMASIAALYLSPFAGIAFLWFIAVIRDQIGDREDRFFSTTFMGSGILFVAMLFISSAVIGSVVVGVRFLGEPVPSSATLATLRSLSYVLTFAFGTRAVAVFMLVTATIGLRSGVFPRWFGALGYLLGIILLLVTSLWDWTILVVPAWVAVVSLFIIRRERGRGTLRA